MTGSVYTPSCTSLPAGLPSSATLRVTSSTSSTIWKHIPRCVPNCVSASSVSTDTLLTIPPMRQAVAMSDAVLPSIEEK